MRHRVRNLPLFALAAAVFICSLNTSSFAPRLLCPKNLKHMAITVCIVEDSLELSESVVKYIDGMDGFRCLGAYGTAEEALVEIPKKNPEVVLMDINLPRMSGIQ